MQEKMIGCRRVCRGRPCLQKTTYALCSVLRVLPQSCLISHLCCIATSCRSLKGTVKEAVTLQQCVRRSKAVHDGSKHIQMSDVLNALACSCWHVCHQEAPTQCCTLHVESHLPVSCTLPHCVVCCTLIHTCLHHAHNCFKIPEHSPSIR